MLSIRSAKDTDLPQVRALLKESGLPFEDITAAHLCDFIVIIGDNAAMMGCVGMEPYDDSALLRSLAVQQSIRGTGWGQTLVGMIEKHARGAGIAHLYLLTTTASKFFSERGYHTVERVSAPRALQASAEFASLCPSQAACLYKSLASHHIRNVTHA